MKLTKKRKRFFEESLKLIHEKGFKATTMRDIAKRMNFEVANIYNYIDSKQALLENYLFELEKEFNTNMNNIMKSSYAPKEKIKAIVSFHVHLPAVKPFEVGLLISEWRNLEEPQLSRFINRRTEYESKLHNIVQQGIDNGSIRNLNPHIATQTIFASVRWLYVEYAKDQSAINPVEVEKQILDILFNGILKE